jgi:hypothetical protein
MAAEPQRTLTRPELNRMYEPFGRIAKAARSELDEEAERLSAFHA